MAEPVNPRLNGGPSHGAGGAARHVHDPTLTALAHLREDRLGEIQRRVDVRLEEDAATLQRDVRERSVDRGRGVVHEDVDRATELGGRPRHHAGAIVLVGEVGHDDRDLTAVGAQSISGVLQGAGEVIVRLEGPGDDGDGGTLRREPLCDRRHRSPGWRP